MNEVTYILSEVNINANQLKEIIKDMLIEILKYEQKNWLCDIIWMYKIYKKGGTNENKIIIYYNFHFYSLFNNS